MRDRRAQVFARSFRHWFGVVTGVECCCGEVWVRLQTLKLPANPLSMRLQRYAFGKAQASYPRHVQGFRLPSTLLLLSDAVGVRSR